ncbi:MAG: carbohydrate ABC transporter permease [Geminicoccales bacterium]
MSTRETAGRGGLAEWLDRRASAVFIMPAVAVILAFSIFPLLVSLYLSLARFRLAPGGYELRFAGLANYEKLLLGSEQWHFLGSFGALSALDWLIVAAAVGGLGWWFFRYFARGRVWLPGLAGRLVFALLAGALVVLAAATVGEDASLGSLTTTLFYVIVGCSVQFAIGLGLALLCVQPVRGRSFFRVVFFLPLMITPVGIAYAFRMLADMSKGPIAPLWNGLGLAELAWAADPWLARLVVVVGDSWQWIPFIFIVMLAALESQPRDTIEAAELDGASAWPIFRDITWPAIMPVAATVMLIRVIEAFKIIDLPNVLTNGGPGTATESLTLHAFVLWRTLDLGGSAEVAYMLLFVTVVVCVSFFNLVVQPHRERQA